MTIVIEILITTRKSIFIIGHYRIQKKFTPTDKNGTQSPQCQINWYKDLLNVQKVAKIYVIGGDLNFDRHCPNDLYSGNHIKDKLPSSTTRWHDGQPKFNTIKLETNAAQSKPEIQITWLFHNE